MNEYLLILVSTILVNNFVLVKFLGLCPFMGVSKKMDTAIGMGFATTFVLTLASITSYLINTYLLIPFELFGAAVGFSFVLVLFSGIRERIESADVPKIFQGVPIALITAGLMSMAFMGFIGLV